MSKKEWNKLLMSNTAHFCIPQRLAANSACERTWQEEENEDQCLCHLYHARLYCHATFPQHKEFFLFSSTNSLTDTLLEHGVVNAPFAFQYGFIVWNHTLRLSHISCSQSLQYGIHLSIWISGSVCRGIDGRCCSSCIVSTPPVNFWCLVKVPFYLAIFWSNLENHTW